MLRRLKKKEERVTEVLSALAEESAKGTLILVEGKKDVEALRTLGVEGKLSTVKTGGKSFLDVVSKLEKVKVSEVVLLLDFDRRGKRGTNRLRQNLEHAGVKVNLEFWLALLKSVGKDVQCVEGLAAYVRNLRNEVSGYH